MPAVQKVILDRERKCDGGCEKVMQIGETVVKQHRKPPLKNAWYCTKCWKKRK